MKNTAIFPSWGHWGAANDRRAADSKRIGFALIEENFGENAFYPVYADMKRWAFHSRPFLMKISRCLRPRQCPKGPVIQDTPIQQDAFFYAKAQHVLETGRCRMAVVPKIYKSFEPYFPGPDLIVFYRRTIESIMEGLKTRADMNRRFLRITLNY